MRNKLNEFDGEPNNNMWDRVENVIPPAPKPMLFRIMKPSAIAASLVLAVAACAMVYQYTSTQNLNQQIIEANDKIKQLEQKIDKNSNEETAQLGKMTNIETVETNTSDNNIEEATEIIDKNEKSDIVRNNKSSRKASNNKLDQTPIANDDVFKRKVNNNDSQKELNSNKLDQTPIANDDIFNRKANNNGSQKELNSNKLDQTPIANDDVFNRKANNNGSQKELNNNKLDQTPIANDNKISDPVNVIGNQQKDKLEKEKIAFAEPFLLDRIRNDEIDNYAYFVMVEPASKALTEKPKFQPRWLVGGFAHSFQTKPDFKERSGPPPAGGNPFKDHQVKPAIGLAIGGKVGLQLNENWTIQTGLAYQQEKIEMKLVDHRDYRKDNENDIGNNRQSYRTNYTTHSPFGEIRVNGEFTKDKDDNIENRPFDIEIDGTHELTSLNIPLYFQVQDQKGRFVYGLKGGVYGRRMIKNSFEATEITSSLSELKSSEVSVIDQPNISNKWTADVLGGVVLAYKHNDHVAISLEPTILMSLGNKHESEYGHTKMRSLGSQLAVQYTF